MHLGTKCVLIHTILTLICVAQVQHAYYEMCVGTKYIPIHDVRTEL